MVECADRICIPHFRQKMAALQDTAITKNMQVWHLSPEEMYSKKFKADNRN